MFGVLPKVGQALAPNQFRAYQYLADSVSRFPEGQAMLDLLAARGLVEPRLWRLTWGITTLYVGRKPARGGSGDLRTC
jgi:demethylmenaquinone methyltransferase/2-methoxy-6-polyprenyl-1,4-benzoquinol methylase